MSERTSETAMIRVRDLHKSFRDGDRRVEVLRGVELDVAAGEMVAVVGPSGSGKSTLLHLLGALEAPDRGEIVVAGQRIAGEPTAGSEGPTRDRRALARFRNRSLGFIFQFHRLLPDFDALENVMLPARIAGMDPERAHDRARLLLVQVGLEDRLDHFPNELSGGERQRVALCRALVLEPPVLLADEPTGNLDPEASERVFELLLEMQEVHGTTTLLVTHSVELAGRCARLFRLDGGVLSA